MRLARLALVLAALGPCALGAMAAPAGATSDAPTAAKKAYGKARGFAAPRPIYRLTLGRGQNSAIAQPKKIVKVVSGDPAIVEVMRFAKATPTIGLMARGAGVTNVLVWTTDAQVHTYRITVK